MPDTLGAGGAVEVHAPRVLVAEDEFLIALLVEEDLRNSGYTVIGPFTTIADAKEAAAHEQIDAAILDINMNGQFSYCVADELIARHVPFMFLSGYGQSALPVHYASRPRLAKPYERGILLREVERLIPAKR